MHIVHELVNTYVYILYIGTHLIVGVANVKFFVCPHEVILLISIVFNFTNNAYIYVYGKILKF